ncbi:IS701 family transposase [Thiocapsa rosea]|uniref:DDE family transposase n=1 Tax=Thiocapsa rosea TaxID=69360 RepID=A0A495VFP1_9GAMM|nr:transposase [Thiocapsa rosea]RKT44374.1 DDE family transposase [Thiocapsa rosea]RKT47650.1 DDE family transposase [Thiocapsa rosea]
MSILPALAIQFQGLFPNSDHGRERARWFILTLQAILLPITASRTSNLLRTIATLFGVVIGEARYYTFMASVKLPWTRIWAVLWRAIPDPLTDGRLLVVLDDSINPKTGTKVFACQRSFDHAAKTNQSSFPWAQTIVTLGLLKVIHGRWCCLPLAFAFYLRRATLALRSVRIRGRVLTFETKFTQAVRLIQSFAGVFPRAPILVVTDSWFGNNGLLKPLRRALGSRAHLLSRLRVNAVLHDLPVAVPGRAGRPRKYGERLGSVKAMQTALRATARTYSLNLYGRVRDVVAAEQVVMLKSLRCQVRVVWVYRRTQWIALVTTDLTLSVEQMIEIYGARWKIEAGFREIKQEIGSAQTQTRNPDAVTNHLHFCMVATTITWIYAASLEQAPARRYAAARRTEYAFADVRRALAHDLADVGFGVDCDDPGQGTRNPLIVAVMRLVA